MKIPFGVNVMRNQKNVIIGAVTDFKNLIEVRLTSLEAAAQYKPGTKVKLTGVVNRSFDLPHFAIDHETGNMEYLADPTPESVMGIRAGFRYLKKDQMPSTHTTKVIDLILIVMGHF